MRCGELNRMVAAQPAICSPLDGGRNRHDRHLGRCLADQTPARDLDHRILRRQPTRTNRLIRLRISLKISAILKGYPKMVFFAQPSLRASQHRDADIAAHVQLLAAVRHR